jgi:uncharacterized repeat protein (TIGR03809 family)
MPAMQGGLRLDEISLKWRALAERRLAYFTELYTSGRWKHYYTPEAFSARMHDVVKAAKAWRELAQRASAEQILAEELPRQTSAQGQRPLPQFDDKYRPAA